MSRWLEWVRLRTTRAPLGLAAGVLAGVLVAALVVPARQHVVHVASGNGPGGRRSAAEAQAEAQQQAAEQAALAAQGAAGTAGGAGGGAAGSAAGGAASATATAGAAVRGVTDTSVKIGVAYLDLGPVAYLGPEFDNGNVPQQWDAILDGWKRQGLLPVAGPSWPCMPPRWLCWRWSALRAREVLSRRSRARPCRSHPRAGSPSSR